MSAREGVQMAQRVLAAGVRCAQWEAAALRLAEWVLSESDLFRCSVANCNGTPVGELVTSAWMHGSEREMRFLRCRAHSVSKQPRGHFEAFTEAA